MANIKLISENAADTATYAASSTTSGFPVSNIGLRDTSLKWKSSSEVFKGFRFSLAAPAIAAALALSHHNAQEDDYWRVRVGTAQFDIDYTDGETGTLLHPFITYGGGTNGTIVNENGVVVPMTQPRLDHDPAKYRNGFLQSDDMSVSPWFKQLAWVLDARTIHFDANGLVTQGNKEYLAADYTISVDVRLVSGSPDFQFRFGSGAGVLLSSTKTATSQWTRVSATFTNSTVTLTGSAGVVKVSAAGVLQFRNWQVEHGSTARYPRATTTSVLYQRIGRLRESARTNLMLRSEDITNAAWAKGNVTASVSSATAPGGSPNAARITENTANTAHSISQGATVIANGYITVSMWVRRAVGSRHARLQVNDGSGAHGFTAYFDLSNFTVSVDTLAIGSGLAVAGAVIQKFPGGWARISCSGKMDAASTAATFTVFMMNATSGTAVYTGDGTSAIDVWGGQLENAQGVSSYIPTTSAAVTRTVDTAFVDNGADVTVGSAEGTLYVALIPSSSFVTPAGTLVGAAAITDGTVNNRIRLRVLSDTVSPTVDTIVVSGGATTWDSANAPLTVGAEIRTAIAYRANEFDFYASSASPATNSALSVPSGLTRINLDEEITRPTWQTRVAYWNKHMTRTQLAAMVASSPSASGVGYDSGFIKCLQMDYSHRSNPPQDWGSVFDLIEHFPELTVTRGAVEFYTYNHANPPTFTDGRLQIGRMFLGKSSWQPEFNAEYGLQSGWVDQSSFNSTPTGKRIFNQKPRYRTESFAFPVLSELEGEQVHEMIGFSGIAKEVLYLRDPDDRALNQQFGFIGTLQQLDPLRAPWFAHHAQAFQLTRQQ
jgi:hypothetical protein